MQLDLFDLGVVLPSDTKQPSQTTECTRQELEKPDSSITDEKAASKPLEKVEEEVPLAFEVGDTVKVNFPSEEEDSEMYNYLEHYFPHIRNRKGKIVEVLPYKKLQYLIEFSIKHEDNTIILYHSNLEWIGQ